MLQSWNDREQIYITQAENYNKTIEIQEQEIDQLKQQLLEVNTERESSAKVSSLIDPFKTNLLHEGFY